MTPGRSPSRSLDGWIDLSILTCGENKMVWLYAWETSCPLYERIQRIRVRPVLLAIEAIGPMQWFQSLRSHERKYFIGSIEHPNAGAGTDSDLYCRGISVSREWHVGKGDLLKVVPGDQTRATS